jgi:DNA-binding NtrC family response regulator
MRARVLCVDDDELVLSSLSRLFRADYEVTTASSGEAALRLVQQQAFDVIVSDQRMPGMKGVELLRQTKELAPQTMRVLLTGYADLTAIVGSVNDAEVFRYITKPWQNEALRQTIAAAADAAITSAHDMARARTALAPAAAPEETVQVLLVDDDRSVLSSVRASCEGLCRVHVASSVEEAMTTIEKFPQIGVIISEVRIDSSDVTELLTTLKRFYPGMVTMVASGYNDADVVMRLINQGQIFRFIAKPISAERVRDLVRRAIQLHRSMQRYPGLATRHVVDKMTAQPRSAPSSSRWREHPEAGHSRIDSGYPTAAAGPSLLSRIAGLFRRR